MIQDIDIQNQKEFVQYVERFMPEIHNYSASFLGRRIRFVMQKMGFVEWREFMSFCKQDSQFLDKFWFNFIVSETELFRDAEVWLVLYNQILPKILPNNPRIWLPETESGQELLSLCILLSEMNALDNVIIFAGNKSKLAIEAIQKAQLPIQNETIYQNNFSEINTQGNLSDYYVRTQNTLNFKKELFSCVEFQHANSFLNQQPKKIDLILFRNVLLYYTDEAKRKSISHLHNQLQYDGYLVLGLKEDNNIFSIETLYKSVFDVERIYRKK